MSGVQWFALQVRTRWEASTAAFLSNKGYATFLPTYKNQNRWGGRGKEIVTPLFPGYVFCNFDAQNRLPILVTPGVVAVVGRGRIPIPVDESEIDSIRSMVQSGVFVKPWPYLQLGQRVRVEDEALTGLEGILIEFKGSYRIVVSVSLLRRSVAMEIDRSRVRPVTEGTTAAFEPIRARKALKEAIA